MRYVEARCQLHDREETYRIYVADALKAIGGLNVRYTDLFGVKETRTAEEIKSTISGKLAQLGGE